MLRQAEQDSFVALSQLVEEDAIQNYRVMVEEEPVKPDAEKAQKLKDKKKAARDSYLEDVSKRAPLFAYDEEYMSFWKLDQLARERRENSRNEGCRTGLEIKK